MYEDEGNGEVEERSSVQRAAIEEKKIYYILY